MDATTEKARKPRPNKVTIANVQPAFCIERDMFVRDATVVEAMATLGCGQSTIYNMIARGDLGTYKVGAATRIRRNSLNALRDGRCEDSKAPSAA